MNVACTGPPSKPTTSSVGLERVDLAAEGVARDDDVEAAERLLPRDRVGEPVGEHDHAGARAVHRHARRDRLADRALHAERARQLVDDARLAAGDDETVDRGELRGSPHERHLGAQVAKDVGVLAHVALEGEDADVATIAASRCVTSHARRGGAARGGPRR